MKKPWAAASLADFAKKQAARDLADGPCGGRRKTLADLLPRSNEATLSSTAAIPTMSTISAGPMRSCRKAFIMSISALAAAYGALNVAFA